MRLSAARMSWKPYAFSPRWKAKALLHSLLKRRSSISSASRASSSVYSLSGFSSAALSSS
jgi:hypothetical protein